MAHLCRVHALGGMASVVGDDRELIYTASMLLYSVCFCKSGWYQRVVVLGRLHSYKK